MNTEDEALIQGEFPDYPLDTLPKDIPAWLRCSAWHNDACPVWYDENYLNSDGKTLGVGLAIDFLDVTLRDYGNDPGEVHSPRFSCWLFDGGQQVGDAFATDDWAAMLVRLEEIRPTPV